MNMLLGEKYNSMTIMMMLCLFVRAINNKTARTCNACELNMIRINCQARLLIISAEISKFNPQSQFRSKRSRANTLGLIARKQPVSHKVAFYFPTKTYCLLQTKSKVPMLKSQCTIKPASHPPTTQQNISRIPPSYS